MCPGGSPVRYSQNDTLVRSVQRFITRFSANSLLDIGAGTLATAMPLANSVARYLAIECDRRRASALADAGLHVIADAFPTTVRGEFDLVLSSHSLPKCGLHEFLTAAWQLVRINGVMLVITFKGAKGHIAAIRNQINGTSQTPTDQRLLEQELFSISNSVQTERVNSFAETHNIYAMIEFLSPWVCTEGRASEGSTSLLMDILESQYKSKNGYIVPIEHLLISTSRCPQP